MWKLSLVVAVIKVSVQLFKARLQEASLLGRGCFYLGNLYVLQGIGVRLLPP